VERVTGIEPTPFRW